MVKSQNTDAGSSLRGLRRREARLVAKGLVWQRKKEKGSLRVFFVVVVVFLRVLFFFFLFRAAPIAHGGSQARGRTGAEVASLHRSYSNARSLTH